MVLLAEIRTMHIMHIRTKMRLQMLGQPVRAILVCQREAHAALHQLPEMPTADEAVASMHR